MRNYNEVKKAKEILKNNGYYIDNLWQLVDVQDKFKNCSDKLAYQILDEVLQNNYIMCEIQETICLIGEDEHKLKFIND
tara:strand:- start:381 stop:617 length:237 start_codon:yes stop_codon:yes gene_type:complete